MAAPVGGGVLPAGGCWWRSAPGIYRLIDGRAAGVAGPQLCSAGHAECVAAHLAVRGGTDGLILCRWSHRALLRPVEHLRLSRARGHALTLPRTKKPAPSVEKQ
jgi:hypothetical protein